MCKYKTCLYSISNIKFEQLTWMMIGELSAAAASRTALQDEEEMTLTAGMANPCFLAALNKVVTLSPVMTPVPISSIRVGCKKDAGHL
jgi:hypothetical protein